MIQLLIVKSEYRLLIRNKRRTQRRVRSQEKRDNLDLLPGREKRKRRRGR